MATKKTDTKPADQGQQAQSTQAESKAPAPQQQAKAPAKADDNSLTAALERRKIDIDVWKAVKASIFPGAKDESILMAFDYCSARKLDIMKKPCHIVPMRVYNAKTDNYEWRDIIMPGVAELRMTAFRTGLYIGLEQEAGEVKEITIGEDKVSVPEFIKTKVTRLVKLPDNSGYREANFYHIERFVECCAVKKEGKGENAKVVGLNAMWSKRPIGQMEKCSEAGALRKAFPEEIGNDYAAEEMEGKTIVVNAGEGSDKPSQSDAMTALSEKLTEGNQAQHNPPAMPEGADVAQQKATEAASQDNKEWLKDAGLGDGGENAAPAEGGENQAQE